MSDDTALPAKRTAVTIREVAQRAGVSQMTVSRVLNQPDLVKAETTQRVQDAIKALNYRPNLMARGLAGGKSLLIGLIYHNPSANYLGEVLLGATNACSEKGHHLLVENYGPDLLTNPTDLHKRIHDSGVDGLIVCPPLGENLIVTKELTKSGIPCVYVSAKGADATHPHVVVDETAAASLMTNYLIDQGHRKIGLITGDPDQRSSPERQRGFQQAMLARGLTKPPDYIVEGAYTYRSGMDGAQKLLALADPPTAIFASNDDMAAGVIAAVQQLGLQVPGDVSVAGFDDTSLAQTIWPGLTTIRQPISAMARTAVALLEKTCRGEDRQEAVLEFSLVKRESVAPPSR